MSSTNDCDVMAGGRHAGLLLLRQHKLRVGGVADVRKRAAENLKRRSEKRGSNYCVTALADALKLATTRNVPGIEQWLLSAGAILLDAILL